MAQAYVIHSRDGKIGEGTDTTVADLDQLAVALRNDERSHLAVHFHGGLVTKAVGLEIARRLGPQYGVSALSVFYVWESGFFETLRNNLRELPDEPVFKQLVRKLLEYVLNELGGKAADLVIAPGSVQPAKVRKAIDKFWDSPVPDNVPYSGVSPLTMRGGMRAVGPSEEHIQADLESDIEIGAAFATLPDLLPLSRSALASAAVEHRSTFSEMIADRVGEGSGGRGLIVWYKVAKLVKSVLVKILTRYNDGRDHGLYATVVEEVLRECKLGGSGINEWGKALQWNRMKQDTLDAFGDGADLYAGTALLSRLATLIEADKGPKRITLIGHSTGAIYIANWLDKAEKMLPANIRFDIVLLAPAISYETFDRTLTKHKHRIGQFRMFAMRDQLERDDQVWGDDTELDAGKDWRRLVYPSSLLYLVSGILESYSAEDGTLIDAPDMPLLGLERHYAFRAVYKDQDFPALARVRAWLDEAPHRIVWSRSENQGDGLNSLSNDHGAFDNDEQTLGSIAAVLKGW
jgi:hypothetical protein